MRTSTILAPAFILAGTAWAVWAATPVAPPAAAAPTAPAAHGSQPIVVELFQSQGCSDCPPALANLARLADRPDVLALSYGVTYWDQLGWKDTFASPQFTQRQRDYSAHNNNAGVATPQYWINGKTTVLGANPARVAQVIAGGGPVGGPALALRGGKLAVGAGAAPKGGADLWLVRYDPRTIAVPIRVGENGGRTLPHRDIVRQLTRIGQWTGAAETVALPAGGGNLKAAVLVQAPSAGPILSAIKL